MTVILQRRCGAFTADGRCPGRILATFELGDLLHGECDRCGADFALPKLKADPALRRQRRLEHAQLPARFAGRKFVEDDANRTALTAVRSWLAGYRDRPIPAPAFFGEAGRGKTHLLVATCWKLISERELTVAFWTVRGLMRALQQFDDELERRGAWEKAVTVDVLALDDVGAMQQTDWRLDRLADLIDERYQKELPVLVATNYAPSAWRRMLDERTASRLASLTFPVELAGPDRRTTPQP